MAKQKRGRDELLTGEKRLLALASLGEECPDDTIIPANMLTAAETAELDAYVAAATAKIRSKWSAKREAEARGIDVRATAKIFQHDGRFFPCSTGAEEISEQELVHSECDS